MESKIVFKKIFLPFGTVKIVGDTVFNFVYHFVSSVFSAMFLFLSPSPLFFSHSKKVFQTVLAGWFL